MAEQTEASGPRRLRAWLLGQVRLELDGHVISEATWSRRAARSLLLLLLISPGRALPRERVQDLLWPELPPEAATNALAKALHALRHALEPALRDGRNSRYVRSDLGEIALRPEAPIWTDVTEFTAALAAADRQTEPEARRQALRQALTLYHGDLLASELYADWPVAPRAGLRQRWLDSTLALAQLDLAAGEPLAAVTPLDNLLASEPLLEEAHHLLIRAHIAAEQPAEALRHYARYQAVLAQELAAEPSAEMAALIAPLLAAPAAQPAPLPVPRIDRVPVPPTPLIGRERELDELQEMIQAGETRLVTLTGSPGIGKTRLALEVARLCQEQMAHGAVFVELAPIRDAARVLPALAHAVDVREEADQSLNETLCRQLRDRQMLLVLDNFEHVAAAGPEIAQLLEACPDIIIVVTSRAALGLRQETLFEVPPLSVPPVKPPSLSRLLRYAAVTLLMTQIQAVAPGFDVTEENADAVAATCVKLEGVPLAIELAAARARHLSPATLLARLNRRLDFLTGGPRDLPERQQTLRAALAWSYELLTPAEQALFCLISVFAGSGDRDAVAGICERLDWPELAGFDPDAGLASLTEKHLVGEELSEAGARITMLETLREFGQEQLRVRQRERAVRQAHADWFTAVASQAAPHLRGPEQARWFDRLEIDLANLQMALDWLMAQRQVAAAVEMVVALARFWDYRGYLHEGIQRVDQVLALAEDAAVPPELRGEALNSAAFLREHIGDYERAIALREKALALARAVGDRQREVHQLDNLGNIAQDRGEYERAIAHHNEALTIAREIDDQWGTAAALGNLGAVALYQGQNERAARYYEESLGLMRTLGDTYSVAIALNNLGVIYVWLGDFARGVEMHTESLALRRQIGDRTGMASSLINLAEVRELQGGWRDAEDDYAEALDVFREMGDRRSCALALRSLSRVAMVRGDATRAADLAHRGIEAAQQVGDKATRADLLEVLAQVAMAEGRPDEAAQRLGAADRLRADIKAGRDGVHEKQVNLWQPAVENALGADAFREAWETGQAAAEATLAAAMLDEDGASS